MIDKIWKLNKIYQTAKRISEMKLTDTDEHRAAKAGAIALVAAGKDLILYRGYLGNGNCYWRFHDLDNNTYTAIDEDGEGHIWRG